MLWKHGTMKAFKNSCVRDFEVNEAGMEPAVFVGQYSVAIGETGRRSSPRLEYSTINFANPVTAAVSNTVVVPLQGDPI